jgi:hypothetical protein
MSDRKDDRLGKVFDYVCVPKDVNQDGCDIDFTKWSTEEFLREVMKLKEALEASKKEVMKLLGLKVQVIDFTEVATVV